MTLYKNAELGTPRGSFGRRIEWHTQFRAKGLHFTAIDISKWNKQQTSDGYSLPGKQWISVLMLSLDSWRVPLQLCS